MEITKTRPLHANGTLREVPRQTEDTFLAMIKAFLCHYVGKDPGKCQVSYICNHLKWPRDLEVHTCAACLKDINAVITKLPNHDVLLIPDLKLCDVFIWMVPM